MRLSGSRRTEALPGQPPRRRPGLIRLAALVSLLIHVAIGVLLLVTIRREDKTEMLPPPSAVTMLFESGSRNGPTLPEPGLQAVPSAPPAPETPPVKEAPLPAPPLPPAPQPPAPSPQVPSPQVPSPQVLAPAQTVAPPVEVQPPPPPIMAEQVPIPPPLEAKPSPAPKPPPVRLPPKQAAPPKPSDFPAPMNFSFGTPHPASPPPARSPSTPHIPGTIDMSLGPASRGTADPTPFGDQDAAGADWRNALSQWVAEHAYYPEQARHEFQEGDAKVHVLAEPNGRVKEVELIGKSGSIWLDMALVALFRDQHIPPLPSGDKEPIDFNFTMHYVLIRPR